MAAASSSSGGVPPGFRFHPTDEELLLYYLRKKLSFERFDLEVIREVDLNKMEPWELQERCRIGSAPQNEWYFFSHKDKKYPTGSRTNRATSAGFWKATGRDKCIRNSYKKIGMRKTLVFYRGRAPHGQKTDWIMHEYRLEEGDSDGVGTGEDGWVVCRVFKKKHLFKLGGEGSSGNESQQQMPFLGAAYLQPEELMEQAANLYGPDLELHYVPAQHYSSQVQNLLPDQRGGGGGGGGGGGQPPSYDYPSLARQFDMGGGRSSSCEPMIPRDPNEWTMLVSNPRLAAEHHHQMAAAAAAGGGMEQVGHIPNPCRGEMDLWGGYGK